jgi:hypothetical protein
LVDYRSFYFRGPEGKMNLQVHNLSLFVQVAEGIDAETLARGRASRQNPSSTVDAIERQSAD